MRERLQRFMMGRYGSDGLNRCISISSLVLMLLAMFTRINLFYWVALVLLVFCYYRMFSRNTGARARENYAYYGLKQNVQNWFTQQRVHWAQRGMYKYFRCPSCRQPLRVPRGHGKVAITCPKCHTEFMKKS